MLAGQAELLRTEIGLPKMVLIDLCYSMFLGVTWCSTVLWDSLRFLYFLANCLTNFFDEFFWQIIWRFFFDEILMNFDFSADFFPTNINNVSFMQNSWILISMLSIKKYILIYWYFQYFTVPFLKSHESYVNRIFLIHLLLLFVMIVTHGQIRTCFHEI